MKLRQGFVSNSSSSSFIVLLPESVKKKQWENEALTLLFIKLVTNGELAEWDEEYNGSLDQYDKLLEQLDSYVIATVDVGSDDGSIVVANQDTVRKILNI